MNSHFSWRECWSVDMENSSDSFEPGFFSNEKLIRIIWSFCWLLLFFKSFSLQKEMTAFSHTMAIHSIDRCNVLVFSRKFLNELHITLVKMTKGVSRCINVHTWRHGGLKRICVINPWRKYVARLSEGTLQFRHVIIPRTCSAYINF